MTPHQCEHIIVGPKCGRLLAWKKQCKRRVGGDQRYCWQHRGEHQERTP